jgi:hypothetical protein
MKGVGAEGKDRFSYGNQERDESFSLQNGMITQAQKCVKIHRITFQFSYYSKLQLAHLSNN